MSGQGISRDATLRGRFPKAALFDLDGTLLDSAPDLLATVNRMLQLRGRPHIPLSALRPHVSKGGRAMIAAAFPELDEDGCTELVPELLQVYAGEIGKHGFAFPGVEQMLAALDGAGVPWGIVTNKPEGLARDCVEALGWSRRSRVLVGGDTLAERKPHPLPLLHSAEVLGIAPSDCVYVGDDERDIQAALAAGMPSVAALWGYRPPGDDPAHWGGDVMVEQPIELADPGRWP